MTKRLHIYAGFADFLLIIASFLVVDFMKTGEFAGYLERYYGVFTGFAVLWIALSSLGHKYRMPKRNLTNHLGSVIRVNFVIFAFCVILIYLFGMYHLSRAVVFGSVLSLTVLELAAVFLFYTNMKIKKELDLPGRLTRKARVINEGKKDGGEEKIPSFPALENPEDSITRPLKEKHFRNFPELYDFIETNVDLKAIHRQKSSVLNTSTLFNIENVEEESQRLFVNLHKINDIRRINRFFIQANQNLETGGYFVCCVETLSTRYNRLKNKYPPFFYHVFFAFNFIFTRVFPKLPVFKEIYFFLTRGQSRAVSKAEVLGRLCYCGFQIADCRSINGLLYVAARKISPPVEDESPTYGPLVKLPRIGRDGKIIYIYKFRTMHPYSEYLQDYIYRTCSLDDSGKFKGDFRVTGWGKVFRKLWIDEFPQFLNIFRGELSLVGVRALSEHYFSLYPPDMRELRVKHNPGLVPPYYADMPETFEEIVESERNYLRQKGERPFLTDARYFINAWKNILFKGARSK